MKLDNKKILVSLWLLAALIWPTLPLGAQPSMGRLALEADLAIQDDQQILRALLEQGRGAEFPVLLEKLYGAEAAAAAEGFNENAEWLYELVMNAAGERAAERLEQQIEERKTGTKPVAAADLRTEPAGRALMKLIRLEFNGRQRLDWRQLAFGFQPLRRPDDTADVKMTETDREIKAEGSGKKSFETREAKGTRTQKAETRYTKDGKTFGVEIKNTEIIEAVSKPDGKSFRKELSMTWGADVAACPDANGVAAGTGRAKVLSKTIYTEGGATVTMISEFDLQAKLTGSVNDKAELTHYDLVIDAYTQNSGYEEALRRDLIKEMKIRDGRYGIHYDIPGNTIENSDGRYGGKRTPAKMGKATAQKLTPMTDSEAAVVDSAIGKMVPTIWNSANEMYSSAQRSWRNYGCVEVVFNAPKTTLEPGEEVSVSAETVHLQDGGKINAELSAEAYEGNVTPESQRAAPRAAFTFTQVGEENSSLHAESVSKRGIGKGEVEFHVKKEKEAPTEAGVWTGTIKAERKQREEREKRSGSNLAENGGYLETTASVQLQLTGRRDRSVEASNAFLASISGEQQLIDYEYDRYKIDEGYCGPSATPFKGPKEITRTSTTTINYNKETRVYVEVGRTRGSITFSLPDQNGSTLHKYVHKSPCSDNDRANTNEAKDEEVAGPGGSFSFSFPVDPTRKTIAGTITVREEDGGTTTYRWELSRR